LKSHAKPAVYISTSGCTELSTVSHNETHLHVGACVTIDQLETSLLDLCRKLPGTDYYISNEYCLIWIVHRVCLQKKTKPTAFSQSSSNHREHCNFWHSDLENSGDSSCDYVFPPRLCNAMYLV